MTTARETIISVEDSDTDFMALRFALRSSGVDADIERYENGGVAMDQLGASCPLASRASLILLDLNLPGVDGRRVLTAVRRFDPARQVPVIVLSTSSHQRDIEFCYRAGADAYVVKPFELDDWERKIGPLAGYWLKNAADRKRDTEPSPQSLPKTLADASPLHIAQLMRAIEGEIIPRLLLAHGQSPLSSEQGNLSSEIAELARLALARDVTAAAALLDTMQKRGGTLDMLFKSHVAPAARLVGDIWKADLCTFAEFEHAFACLQDLLARIEPGKTRGETIH